MKKFLIVLSLVSLNSWGTSAEDLLRESCRFIKGDKYASIVFDCSTKSTDMQEVELCVAQEAQLIIEEREKCASAPYYYFKNLRLIAEQSPQQQQRQQQQRQQSFQQLQQYEHYHGPQHLEQQQQQRHQQQRQQSSQQLQQQTQPQQQQRQQQLPIQIQQQCQQQCQQQRQQQPNSLMQQYCVTSCP